MPTSRPCRAAPAHSRTTAATTETRRILNPPTTSGPHAQAYSASTSADVSSGSSPRVALGQTSNCRLPSAERLASRARNVCPRSKMADLDIAPVLGKVLGDKSAVASSRGIFAT